MTVFVDDFLLAATIAHGRRVVRGRWSHLMADTTDELAEFATQLRLSSAWIQKPNTPHEHYDITAGKRTQALQLGAVDISYGETGHLAACKRVGIYFDVYLLRRDLDAFLDTLAVARAALGDRPLDPSGPVRIQLSRRRGWRLPPNTVSVASPTKWANPFRPAQRTLEANTAAVERYREYLAVNPDLVRLATTELAGRNLACWCSLAPVNLSHPGLPCHADVLLAIANA